MGYLRIYAVPGCYLGAHICGSRRGGVKIDVDLEEIINNSKDITDSMVLHTTEATEINLM